MNFGEAVQSGFANYVNFSTRASRSEYWYWVLFVVLVNIVLALVERAVFGNLHWSPLTNIFSLAIFLPSLGLAVRRLHDIGRTGWWVLLSLIPLIGSIILIYWACLIGESGDNEYGPNPLGA